MLKILVVLNIVSHLFLGASPDGINTNNRTSLFGRMLEIKNVVSREINGIPKEDYWIQNATTNGNM